MHDDDLAAIKDVMAPITKRLGLAGAVETAIVWRRWAEIVGPAVADHAEPTSLREGVLRVRTDSPVWATEIGYLADEIRTRINALAHGELVRRVVVWTGRQPARGERTQRATRQDSAPTPSDSTPDPVAALERARAAWERRRGGRR